MAIHKDVSDFPAKYYVQLNNSGTDVTPKTRYTLLRPYGRSDYYLLYVANGYLDVIIQGKWVRATAGQCILHFPGERQEIRYPSGCKLTVYFAHFTGRAIDETMENLGLERVCVCDVTDPTMFELYFKLMIEDFLAIYIQQGGGGICKPNLSGLIFQMISMLDKRDTPVKDDRITSQMLYIGRHFKEDIDLERLAEQAYVSPSRFAHLFTKKIGVSPHKLLLSLRIDEAKKLLSYSSMTISEIGYDVGFSDPAYFSRIFKKTTGFSPSDYRKKKE